MQLTPPKQIVFIISLVLAVLGLLGMFGILIPVTLASWLLLAAFVVLALGVALKDF